VKAIECIGKALELGKNYKYLYMSGRTKKSPCVLPSVYSCVFSAERA